MSASRPPALIRDAARSGLLTLSKRPLSMSTLGGALALGFLIGRLLR